jgi:hypothetical protein
LKGYLNCGLNHGFQGGGSYPTKKGLKKGSNIGVSKQPMDKSQIRQQQSIRNVLIRRKGVFVCIFQWGLHGGIIGQMADYGTCCHYGERLHCYRFSTTTGGISIPTTAIDPQGFY